MNDGDESPCKSFTPHRNLVLDSIVNRRGKLSTRDCGQPCEVPCNSGVRLLPSGMPSVYVQVLHQQTGRPVRRLGPYASAAIARTACSTLLGQALVWTRQDQDWVAELDGHEYRIPADPPIEA